MKNYYSAHTSIQVDNMTSKNKFLKNQSKIYLSINFFG